MARSVLCVVCLLVLVLTVVTSVPTKSRVTRGARWRRDATDGLLPRTTEPYHYNLELQPDIYSTTEPPFNFTGYVEILIRATEVTNTIVVNSRQLTIIGILVGVNADTPVPSPSPILLEWYVDEAANFLTMKTANSLVVGAEYYLRITYKGVLASNGNGLYYDKYVDTDGSTKYLVATQMESIEARGAFPCYDEPDMKATFSITVVSKAPHVTLSNMNEISTADRGNGWTAHYFAKSPIMSSYQVCTCVGDFIYEEAEWQGVTTYPVRIYARPQMAGNLNYAAKIVAKLQAWLETETGIPYPLPKMDHIALPGKGGAMENWGLITYGEDYLCVNPQTSGGYGKNNVVSITAHEIAHSWYGNWVTCEWWTDIWLNEGFATYYNYYPQETLGYPASILQQVDPRRGTMQFLDIDQRNTSDPVRKIIDTVWEADDSFGGSTYPKGGALLRQMSSILGPATMRRGFTRYLNKYNYSNAVTDDLWVELSAQAAADGVLMPDGSAIDMKSLMDPWLNQMGYPVVTVTRNGDGTATVTSRRFFNPRGQTADTPSDYNYSWDIPITVATAATTNWDMAPSQYIKFGQTTATLTGVPSDGNWLMINARQLSFFRVDYDNILRNDIVNQLLADFTKIPPESRAQFVDDSFALSRTLAIPETLAMDATQYLHDELEQNAWTAAIKHFAYGRRLLRNVMWLNLYNEYILDRLVPVYNETAWIVNSEDSPLYAMFRGDIALNTCIMGWADCKTVARGLYNTYKANPDTNSVHPDQLPTVLCTGVAEGGSTDWSMVWDQYQKRRPSPIREERYAYLFGLACSTDTVWQERYLNYIIRGELIDARDQNTALSYMLKNNVGLPVVWSYLDNSWTTVPSGIDKFSALRTIVGILYDQTGLDQFDVFVAKYPPQSQSEQEYFTQYRLIIVQNMDWFAANETPLSEWLVAHTKSLSIDKASIEASLSMSSGSSMDGTVAGFEFY